MHLLHRSIRQRGDLMHLRRQVCQRRGDEPVAEEIHARLARVARPDLPRIATRAATRATSAAAPPHAGAPRPTDRPTDRLTG
jgi:hypothetical protein